MAEKPRRNRAECPQQLHPKLVVGIVIIGCWGHGFFTSTSSPKSVQKSVQKFVKNQARKKHPNLNFCVQIFSGGVGVFHVKGGGQKVRYVLETQGIKFFWRDIPGFCRDIPETPEKFEKKNVWVQFLAPTKINPKIHPGLSFCSCDCPDWFCQCRTSFEDIDIKPQRIHGLDGHAT